MHLLSEAQLGNEALRQSLIARYREFQELISRKISERTDLPADFLTWLILLASDGMIVQQAIGNTEFDREAFIAEGIRYLKAAEASANGSL